MNPFIVPAKIYISPSPQDMRAGIHRLSAKVVSEFGHDATDGNLYVFVSRDACKCKLLKFDINGWSMTYCTLSEGTFKWRFTQDSRMLELEQRILYWLLDGLEINQKNAPKPITGKKIL